MEKKMTAKVKPEAGNPRLAVTRKIQIGLFVNSAGEATVAELASKFEVSLDTIRRDLTDLETEKVLIKTHGGAVRNNFIPADSNIDLRFKIQAVAKEKIGALAASLIPNDSVIMINAGTTTLEFAKNLKNHQGLTVATNNLLVPRDLSPKSYRALHIFGGTLSYNSNATIGSIGFYNTQDAEVFDIRADWGVFSVGAVSTEKGFSISNLQEATMLRDMMRHCSRVIVLADSSKFQRDLFVQVAELREATYLVSDAPPPNTLLSALKKASVRVITP
jgi:DeoR/GlpR family transcriptional regulator of sugar metabolism